MWRNIITWSLDFIKNLGAVTDWLFSSITLSYFTFGGSSGQGIHWYWVPFWEIRIIDLVSLSGLTIIFVMWIIKLVKIDII